MPSTSPTPIFYPAGDDVARLSQQHSQQHQRAAGTTHSGVMVALFPDLLVARQLAALKGVTEKAEDLHITLAYLGDASTLDLETVKRAVGNAVKQINPLPSGIVSGFGRFTSVPHGSKTVVYASADIPYLDVQRALLCTALVHEGVPAKSEHGFTPHMTLAYMDDDAPTPELAIPPLPLTFDGVILAFGDERISYLFSAVPATPTPQPIVVRAPSTPLHFPPKEARKMGVPQHTPTASDQDELARAVWSTAEQNNLDDSAFAYIAPGGKKDADGRTTPRSLRFLPYKGADGKVDAAHVRNALARLSQANIPAAAKASARKKLVAAAKSVGVDVADDSARAADAPDALTRAATTSDASPDPTADTHTTFYAPIMRRDDAKWEVEGVLTDEGIDTYGTIFDYDSAKRAVERWQGNVREMHQLKAVGRRVNFECDDALRQVLLRVRVSRGAPDTWEKVGDGTLAGFSINAVNAKRELRTVGNRTVPCYTDYDYAEVSLVDVPSNPGAAGSGLVICRAAAFSADGEGYVSDVIETDEPAVVEAPVEAPAEPVVAPTVPETPIVAPVEEPPALVAPVVAPPSSVPSFDELVEQFGIPADQRAMLARAVAQIAPHVGATPPVTPPPAVV
ncbi:MAG TPA: 2'-5' RNA ligase family protein, partial [Ktedonobacterales bacterium]|nr:2'-5' RNA ligase family protein [Ktedonobacterales bacterium]